MSFHLAQVNVARMRGSASDAVMSGLVARIEEMNALADGSPGFVWRLKGSDATPEALRIFAGDFAPFDAQRFFYNMSVWKSVEALKQYVFRTQHLEMLSQKKQWTEHLERACLALWWIPDGHTPSIAESAERLRAIAEKGPTDFAFSFANIFPPANP